MQNVIYFSDTTDPYKNLALEEHLYDLQAPGVTCYLWQNENTVVIGKNQNAWKECRVNLLEAEGGRLARRTSGGGAVYHDLGNLNFTFLLPRHSYDVARQLSVVQRAVKAFGIDTAFTGRNDLVIQSSGAKFSGNAFRLGSTYAMHHGTILLNVDMEKLSRYLAPSPEKLQAKGIQSVRARVENLSSLNGAITLEGMQRALIDAFAKEYGPARLGQPQRLDQSEIERLVERHVSWQWRMGSTPKFDMTLENRFAWGSVEIQLSLKSGHIQEAQVYSDAMDEAFIEAIAPALLGCPLRAKDMGEAIWRLPKKQAKELAAWLMEKGF